MNAISKIFLGSSLFLAGCVQGPWDFWPDEPNTYKGIWVYGHVVAGQPIQNVCFEPVIPLVQTISSDFAFYDSARVQIQGTFNGQWDTLTLAPQLEKPNCFDAPTNILPEKNQDYHLDAVIHWDSAGSAVQSHFTADTHTPTEYHFGPVFALALADMSTYIQDPANEDALRQLLGDSLTYYQEHPLAVDSLVKQNALAIFGALGEARVPFQNGDTLRFIEPPLDLRAHKATSQYSEDVEGLLLTQWFDSTGGKPTSSFDNFFGGNVDTTMLWESGFQHRLIFLENQYNGQTKSNVIDTLGLTNGYLYLGRNVFYAYASGRDYVDYVNTAIASAADSRIRPRGNINGGQGIFAGFVVDSLVIYAKPLPGARIYSYPADRVAACSVDNNWQMQKDCRNYIPTFCRDSMTTSAICGAYAVATALDSSLAWNAIQSQASDSAKVQGERWYCREHDFPAEPLCQAQLAESVQSETWTPALQELINACSDAGWPLEKNSCGNALVAWMRLEKVQSDVLSRVRNTWCKAHAQEKQCSY